MTQNELEKTCQSVIKKMGENRKTPSKKRMSNENNAVLSIILWHAQNKHESMSISSRAVSMDFLSIQFAVFFYYQWQFIALFEFDSYSKMSRILFHPCISHQMTWLLLTFPSNTQTFVKYSWKFDIILSFSWHMMKMYTHKAPENRTKQKNTKINLSQKQQIRIYFSPRHENWLKVENILKCAFGTGNQK